jgi:hypothetical protein
MEGSTARTIGSDGELKAEHRLQKQGVARDTDELARSLTRDYNAVLQQSRQRESGAAAARRRQLAQVNELRRRQLAEKMDMSAHVKQRQKQIFSGLEKWQRGEDLRDNPTVGVTESFIAVQPDISFSMLPPAPVSPLPSPSSPRREGVTPRKQRPSPTKGQKHSPRPTNPQPTGTRLQPMKPAPGSLLSSQELMQLATPSPRSPCSTRPDFHDFRARAAAKIGIKPGFVY